MQGTITEVWIKDFMKKFNANTETIATKQTTGKKFSFVKYKEQMHYVQGISINEIGEMNANRYPFDRIFKHNVKYFLKLFGCQCIPLNLI